jgi:polyhydroxyalkanoate synthase
MTIADDKENPKDGKRSGKPLDAITALRIAMEERLAATYQATAKSPTAIIAAPNPPVSAVVIPDMAEPIAAQPADTTLAKEFEKPAAVSSPAEGTAVPQTPTSRPLSEPHDLAEAFVKISERTQKLWQDFLGRNKNMMANLPSFDPAHLSEAFTVLSDRILHDPDRYADAQITLWQGYIKIWQTALSRMQGKDVAPLMATAPSDKRFLDKDWQSNWIFEFLKQSYLLTAKWTQLLVRQEIADIDPKLARKLDFYMRQLIDAASPSNFWMTNPEVLRTTLATGGENLIKGFENLLSDLERGHGQLRIKMSDEHAFHVGTAENPDHKNDDVKCLATTPGKVVYQNRLIQLIQYEPVTPTVYRTPILILPPWINKFYILDLSPKKSFIGYLVAQGHTVF